MISKSLSTSEKRAALHRACPKLAEFCQALYPLIVAHADDHGRLSGDEFTVKHLIDPASPRKLPDFVAALHLLHGVGLIRWYHVEGKKLIEVVAFAAHQDLKGHTLRPGKLPACPDESAFIGAKTPMGESSPKSPLSKGNLSEGKLRELNPSGGEDVRFAAFWSAYPRKVGKDAARKAFERRMVSDDLLARMLGAISVQSQSRDWTKDGGQFIPHPATWLNGARWEDEPAGVLPAVSGLTHMLGAATKGFLES